MTLMLERIDILAELGDAVLMFAERAKREDVRIEYDEPQDIIPVMGDKNRLRQVFINVIDNALKYSAGAAVQVSLRKCGGQVVLTVADRGPGIPEEDLPRIFERFYRVDKARSRAAGGTGLGLSIVSDTVRRQGGTVEAANGLAAERCSPFAGARRRGRHEKANRGAAVCFAASLRLQRRGGTVRRVCFVLSGTRPAFRCG